MWVMLNDIVLVALTNDIVDSEFSSANPRENAFRMTFLRPRATRLLLKEVKLLCFPAVVCGRLIRSEAR